jgi:hypothetical protein
VGLNYDTRYIFDSVTLWHNLYFLDVIAAHSHSYVLVEVILLAKKLALMMKVGSFINLTCASLAPKAQMN